MKRLAHVFPKALTPEWCDKVIARAVRGGASSAATVGFDANQRAGGGHRTTGIRWLNPESNRDVVAICNRFAEIANRDSFGVDISYGAREYQFGEYRADEAGHYDWHHDVHLQQHPAQRKLSVVIQLSDPSDFKGGALEIHGVGVEAAAFNGLRGSAIVFPSFLWHRVTAVTSGVRYSLVTWFEGRPWH